MDSALIGSLRATLYPPTISLEDIALDISLQSIPKTECKKKFGEGSHLNDSTFASPSNEKQAEFSRGSALEEGVQLISQRLKSLIHQVQLDLKSCIVRGRSHDGCLFLANLGSLLVEDDRNEDSLGESQLFFARTCLFQNLILQYCKEDSQSQPFTILSSTRGGCNGQLRFSWNNSEESRQIELDLAILNDINLWIDYPAIYAVRNAVQHFTAGYHRRANEDLPSMRQSTHLSQPDRAKSILEALMLPNGEQILNEKLQSSNAGMANYIETVRDKEHRKYKKKLQNVL